MDEMASLAIVYRGKRKAIDGEELKSAQKDGALNEKA